MHSPDQDMAGRPEIEFFVTISIPGKAVHIIPRTYQNDLTFKGDLFEGQ
jgi:hypothetical protein